MIELAHVVTGGIIAYKISNPLLSLPLALLSHFATDLLPHWNPRIGREKKKFGHVTKKTFVIVIADSLIGLILGLYLAFLCLPNIGRALIVVLGCLLGILPDFIEAPYYFFGWKNKFIGTIIKIQDSFHWNVSFIYGILFQLLYLSLLFYFIC